jgi:hypothetical protein
MSDSSAKLIRKTLREEMIGHGLRSLIMFIATAHVAAGAIALDDIRNHCEATPHYLIATAKVPRITCKWMVFDLPK